MCAQDLGKTQIQYLALTLRVLCLRHGIRIEGGSLETDLSELEWMANLPGDVFSSNGAWNADPERARKAIRTVPRLTQIRNLIWQARKLSGFDKVVRHIRQITLRPTTQSETQSLDHAFQLELANFLICRLWNVEISPTGADIKLLDYEGRSIGVECKRPVREDSLVKAIHDGCRQLRDRGVSGFVAISLDNLIDPFLVCNSEPATASRHKMSSLIARHTTNIQGALAQYSKEATSPDQILLGVVFCSNFVTFHRDRSTGKMIMNARMQTYCVNDPEFLHANEFQQFLETTILIGEQRQRELTEIINEECAS
jgi:hypothetical protein